MRLPNGDDMIDLMAKKNAAGMPADQPFPRELVDLFAQKAMEDAKLAAEEQEVARAEERIVLERRKAALDQQQILSEQQQAQQGFAQPQGGIPVAGPGGPPPQGMPPEVAQMQAEAQNMNIGQPPL